jgi:beta-1,4-mannooligosaccharide/beta-1,4-mannosyl-N-acetylglucosamine phosphorylase
MDMQRYSKNPIITRQDIPDVSPYLVDATSVFNPGAIKFNDQYVLMLRVQNRGRETFMMMAFSDDGIHFQIEKEVVNFKGLENIKEAIYHCYDPRITFLEGKYYIMFAMDMDSGCHLGLAQTENFQSFEFLGIISTDDNRNGVLFPEKINGKYMRLDRPNQIQLEGGPVSGNAICLSESEDLLQWKYAGTVISGRFHYWDERIGAGPPPIKTESGWLQIYHGIAEHFGSNSIYQAGAMLLDLNDPLKVIARGKYNILEPRELYELTGQVPNVVFPSGAIVEEVDEYGFVKKTSRVNIYYGAADTCVGLAFTTIDELIGSALNS